MDTSQSAGMLSAEIITRVRQDGLAQDELARRAGVARETLSRWETGAQHPSLEALEQVVAAAGYQLQVGLLPADPKLLELVGEQLELGPTDRLKALLHSDWPACRDALRAAAFVGELAVLVGAVAAALRGSPQPPGHGRVDLLIAAEDREEVSQWLLRADARPAGNEQAPDSLEHRERWGTGQGQLTVRDTAAGITDITAVRDRAHPVILNQEDTGLLRVALVEDLAQLAARSPWPEDQLGLAGLRAVLASGRYSTRKRRSERLELD